MNVVTEHMEGIRPDGSSLVMVDLIHEFTDRTGNIIHRRLVSRTWEDGQGYQPKAGPANANPPPSKP